MTKIYASGNDFVVGLKEYTAITEIIIEGVDRWLDVERIKPKREYTSFALSFGVEVFNFEFLFFCNRVEARVCVEKVGNESKIEFGVACYKGSG